MQAADSERIATSKASDIKASGINILQEYKGACIVIGAY